MQEKNTLNATFIVKKLKSILKFKTDLQLAEFLNVRPNTISTWKKRNSVDYNSIITVCDLYEIDLNEVFLSSKRNSKHENLNGSETPLICREVQYQYCMNSESLMESLPRYNFPFVRGVETRAFQVISTNMFPVIEENSFVVCESVAIENIQDNSLVVVVSPTKGIFINRITRMHDKTNVFILSSENAFFNNITISSQDISEIWYIKATLSYNMHEENKFKFINDSFKKLNMAIAKSSGEN